eukprot:c29126_g1_i1 orf=621-3185(-)
MAELPCDLDGVCMMCKKTPFDSDVLLCNGCSSPWHMACLNPPMQTVPLCDWFCPDCNLVTPTEQDRPQKSTVSELGSDILTEIRAIQADPNLTDEQKARKCQDIMGKGISGEEKRDVGSVERRKHKMLEIFDENLNCIFCLQLAERPVTTPCGHNFCLKCFQRWIGQGKKTCGKCRTPIPARMASQPRINSALVIAIRMAKSAADPCRTAAPPKPYYYIQNEDRPDKAFTTERAKKSGKANASSGKIFVTVPPDHFGPITAENDPMRGQGVLVGETWEDRMECRQWGVHLPHVAGISGQTDYGAQSVALSGGYEDDEDHGEWFLYTGSGGRDLSGNKRTNDKQSFDQTFDKYNEALRVSCKRGYPVRVVRSHKEKRSSYAPESGVRYDGIYRIEKCWRKVGIQGFRVCRYLFVRCDNEPAPWTSDEHGDKPRPLPVIGELKGAIDITGRKVDPAWDWKPEEGLWGWTRSPPPSRKIEGRNGGQKQVARKSLSIGQRLLKEFGCSLCRKVLRLPLSTPCGHNFCKTCLESVFEGQKAVRERTGVGGRPLRVQKVIKHCPSCQADITEFLVNPQVNWQMGDVIQSLKRNAEEESDVENDGKIEEYQGEQVDMADVKKNIDVESTTKMLNMTDDNGKQDQYVVGSDTSDAIVVIPERDYLCNGSGKHVNAVGEFVTLERSKKSCQNVANMKSNMDAATEKDFQKLCDRYHEYSKEVLHSMLMDQEGDILELGSLLRTLKRQENKTTKRKLIDGEDSKMDAAKFLEKECYKCQVQQFTTEVQSDRKDDMDKNDGIESNTGTDEEMSVTKSDISSENSSRLARKRVRNTDESDSLYQSNANGTFPLLQRRSSLQESTTL